MVLQLNLTLTTLVKAISSLVLGFLILPFIYPPLTRTESGIDLVTIELILGQLKDKLYLLSLTYSLVADIILFSYYSILFCLFLFIIAITLGINIAESIAIITITINNSISVKPFLFIINSFNDIL